MVCVVAALWWIAPRVGRDAADLPRQAGTSSSGAVPAGPPPPVQQATTNPGPADATAEGAGETARLASTDAGRGSGPRVAVALRLRSPQGADTTSAREAEDETAPVIPPVVVARLEIDAIGVEPLATTQAFSELPLPIRLELTPIDVERLGPER